MGPLEYFNRALTEVLDLSKNGLCFQLVVLRDVLRKVIFIRRWLEQILCDLGFIPGLIAAEDKVDPLG